MRPKVRWFDGDVRVGRSVAVLERRSCMGKTWRKKGKMGGNAKPTEFSLLAPEARRVSIRGSFNQWDPSSHALERDQKGVWRISVLLSPGRYEYRFFVDGEWQTDPSCSTLVENAFGTLNCVRIVK